MSDHDPVNKPSHYQRGGYECIDILKAISTPAEFAAYCRLTAIAYLWRMGRKDDEGQEAGKVRMYAQWLEESFSRHTEEPEPQEEPEDTRWRDEQESYMQQLELPWFRAIKEQASKP